MIGPVAAGIGLGLGMILFALAIWRSEARNRRAVSGARRLLGQASDLRDRIKASNGHSETHCS